MRWSGNTKKILTGLFIVLFIVSMFSCLIVETVKADMNSVITTGINANKITSNQYMTVSINGYDIFSAGNKVLCYNGNGSTLSYTFNVPVCVFAGYSASILLTKIAPYNATAILIVSMELYSQVGAGFVGSGYAFYTGLLDTQQFKNKTWTLDTTNRYGSGGSLYNQAVESAELTLLYLNNNYYAFCNAKLLASTVKYRQTIDLIQSTGLTNKLNVNQDTAISTMLDGGSFYIQSQTQLNTAFVIGHTQGTSANYSIIKVDCVTPSVTSLISTASYNFDGNWTYYIDYAYQTINGNSYYDVMFLNPAYGTTNSWYLNYLRFNDTNFVNDWVLSYVDTNAFGNKARVIGCLIPFGIWGNPNNPTLLYNGNSLQVSPLYAGQLAYIYAINIYINQTDTVQPMYNVASSGAYRYNNGGNNINIFSSSNSVGGLLSPYGYGNEFQIDYQNNQCCSDYQNSNNPATALYISWNINPINAPNNVIMPQTYNSYALSQNTSYWITSTMRILGVVQTSGTFSVWSNGESTSTVFGRDYNIPIATNAQINSITGAMIFPIAFTNTMTNTPTYESYLMNVTTGNYTYSYTFAFSWWFQDNNGVPLPNTYNGHNSGNGENNGNGDTTGTTGSSPFTFYWAVIIVYVVVCIVFTLLAGKSGLIAGLILSTVFCMIAGLIPVWVLIPIILAVVALLFYSRDTGGN